jgi:hypothetical protein
MTDRHTKFLLWIIAIGVWANVFHVGATKPTIERTLRVVDNIDSNLAWANTHLKAIRDARP